MIYYLLEEPDDLDPLLPEELLPEELLEEPLLPEDPEDIELPEYPLPDEFELDEPEFQLLFVEVDSPLLGTLVALLLGLDTGAVSALPPLVLGFLSVIPVLLG